jgi:hypothetical protein
MAITLTPVSARSNRLTYSASSTGAAAAPSETGTRTNVQLLADFIALLENNGVAYPTGQSPYAQSPLYQVLKATYANETALDAATLAGGSGVVPNGGGVRVRVRPTLAPIATTADLPATFTLWPPTAILTLGGGTNVAPLLSVIGPPNMNTASGGTPWFAYIDIEYNWSGKGA